MASYPKRRSKVLATITITIVLLLVIWIWDLTAAARGGLMARFDLARGRYAVLAYGLPLGGSDEYARLLKERYGIERRQIALCIVDKSTMAYADSYNQLSVAAAQRKFGQGIFEQTRQDAQRMWLHQRFPRERIVSYLFSYIGKPTGAHHDPVCLRSIKPGMKMAEVVERCGSPDEDQGSDKYQFVYRLPDGGLVTITTGSLLKIEQVTSEPTQHRQD